MARKPLATARQAMPRPVQEVSEKLASASQGWFAMGLCRTPKGFVRGSYGICGGPPMGLARDPHGICKVFVKGLYWI